MTRTSRARPCASRPASRAGDELVFTNQSGISGSYNAGTGVLTLTGTATVANYQAALRSIQFRSTNVDPGRPEDGRVHGQRRRRGFERGDQGHRGHRREQRASGRRRRHAQLHRERPGHPRPFGSDRIGAGGRAHRRRLRFDHAGFQAGQDVLAWSDNNLADNIVLDALNSSAQTIVLTGGPLGDTAANYQAALRAVTYQNTSESPSTASRTATFSASDVLGATGSDTSAIAVTSVDDPPVAVDDSATVLEDAAATAVPVLANDTDVDGGPKAISSATRPGERHGGADGRLAGRPHRAHLPARPELLQRPTRHDSRHVQLHAERRRQRPGLDHRHLRQRRPGRGRRDVQRR